MSVGSCDQRTKRGQRGATPRPRSGAEARGTPCPKGSSQEELPHVRGQGQRLRVPGCNGTGTAENSDPSPWSGVAAERSYPMSEVRGRSQEDPMPEGQRPRGATPRLRSGAVAERSYPTSEVRGGGREELPDIQGKEWQLCFAGAAVKRYHTSKVREIQVR